MHPQRRREFNFRDDNFEFLRELAARHIGIKLTDAKRELVYGRISRRIRQLGLSDFDAYCNMLANDAQELVRFVNAVTTNLTYFFREPHHFEYLAQRSIPELARIHAKDRRVRFWSAGCSTGEEAYSISMTLQESGCLDSRYDVKLLATDIDSDVVAKARAGDYRGDSKGLSRRRVQQWFDYVDGRLHAKPKLREPISFRQLNLMGCWPMKGPFDAIFCRNVVIYFDKDTQRILFERMADLLTPHGLLFLGHSESLFKVSDRFELLGRTIYRKIR